MREKSSYQLALADLAYAFGKPEMLGLLKNAPADFLVTELLEIEFSDQGEHVWLDITKTQQSTERVAKSLARYAGVAYRDIGYAGMKDVYAVTRQWFSVWLPKNPNLDWGDFTMEGVEVNAIKKHHRKLKRGAHKGNQFLIKVTQTGGDLGGLESRVQQIQRFGVPNYFGEQRFGRDASNLSKAESFFQRDLRIKDRNLKSIVLSAARSFLFNLVVSGRVSDQNWRELMVNEPASLNGGNSIFASKQEPENLQRLQDLDIHPTAPMWGRGAETSAVEYHALFDWEISKLLEFDVLREGLERHGLEYQRRALRCVPSSFKYQVDEEEDVVFEFSLQSGQFATSVLRELVCDPSIEGKAR